MSCELSVIQRIGDHANVVARKHYNPYASVTRALSKANYDCPEQNLIAESYIQNKNINHELTTNIRPSQQAPVKPLFGSACTFPIHLLPSCCLSASFLLPSQLHLQVHHPSHPISFFPALSSSSINSRNQESNSLRHTSNIIQMSRQDSKRSSTDSVTSITDDQSLSCVEVWDAATVLEVASVAVGDGACDAGFDGC